MSNSLSARIGVASTGQVFVKFGSGALRKSIEQLHIWLKSDNTVGHIAWRHQCVPCRLQRYMYWDSTENALLFFHGNASVFITLLTATCVRQHYRGNTLLRLHGISGCAIAPHCNVLRSLPASFRWIKRSPPAATAIRIEPHRPVLLGAFAKFLKATVNFAMSVRPSVCPRGTTPLPLVGFLWSLICEYFSKVWRENSSLIKIGQE
jgi:hypothetical protein